MKKFKIFFLQTRPRLGPQIFDIVVKGKETKLRIHSDQFLQEY